MFTALVSRSWSLPFIYDQLCQVIINLALQMSNRAGHVGKGERLSLQSALLLETGEVAEVFIQLHPFDGRVQLSVVHIADEDYVVLRRRHRNTSAP